MCLRFDDLSSDRPAQAGNKTAWVVPTGCLRKIDVRPKNNVFTNKIRSTGKEEILTTIM